MYIRPEDDQIVMHAAIFISPIVVLVVVLNSQEGVGEDVYEGHSDGRTQPAVKSGLSAVSQTLKLSYRPCLKHFSSLSIMDVFGWT